MNGLLGTIRDKLCAEKLTARCSIEIICLCMTLHRNADKRIGIRWIKNVYIRAEKQFSYSIIHYIDWWVCSCVPVLYWIINKIYRYNSVCNRLDSIPLHFISIECERIQIDLLHLSAIEPISFSKCQHFNHISTAPHTVCVCANHFQLKIFHQHFISLFGFTFVW